MTRDPCPVTKVFTGHGSRVTNHDRQHKEALTHIAKDRRHRSRHDLQPDRVSGQARRPAEVYPGPVRHAAVSFGRERGCGRIDRRRPGRAAPPADAARAHDLFREAPDGPRPRRRAGRAENFSVSHRSGEQKRDSRAARRARVHAAGNFRVHPARTENVGRGIISRIRSSAR